LSSIKSCRYAGGERSPAINTPLERSHVVRRSADHQSWGELDGYP